MASTDASFTNVSDDDPDANHSTSFASMKAKVKHATQPKPVNSLEQRKTGDERLEADSGQELRPEESHAESIKMAFGNRDTGADLPAKSSLGNAIPRMPTMMPPIRVNEGLKTTVVPSSHSSTDRPVAKKLKLIDALPMMPTPSVTSFSSAISAKDASHKSVSVSTVTAMASPGAVKSHASSTKFTKSDKDLSPANLKKKRHDSRAAKTGDGQRRLSTAKHATTKDGDPGATDAQMSKPKRGRPAKIPKLQPPSPAIPQPPPLPNQQRHPPVVSSRRGSASKQQQQLSQQPAFRQKTGKKARSDSRVEKSRKKPSVRSGAKRARTISRLPLPSVPVSSADCQPVRFIPVHLPCEHLQCPNVAPPSARLCLLHAMLRVISSTNNIKPEVDADTNGVLYDIEENAESTTQLVTTPFGAPLSSAEDVCIFASSCKNIDLVGDSEDAPYKCHNPSLNAQFRSSRRASKIEPLNNTTSLADGGSGGSSVATVNVPKHYLPFTNYCSSHAAWLLENNLAQQNAMNDNIRLGSNLVQHTLNSYRSNTDVADSSTLGSGPTRSRRPSGGGGGKEEDEKTSTRLPKSRGQWSGNGSLFQLRMPYVNDDDFIFKHAAAEGGETDIVKAVSAMQLTTPMLVDKAYSTFMHDDIDFADSEQQSAAANSTSGGVLQAQQPGAGGGWTSLELIDEALDKCLELISLYNSAKLRCASELKDAYTTYAREARQEAETLGSCRSTAAKLPGQTVDYERTRTRLGACKLNSREKWLLRDEMPLPLEQGIGSFAMDNRRNIVQPAANCIYRTVRGVCCANRAAPLSQFCCTHIGFDRTQHMYTTCPVVDGDVCGVSSVPFHGHKFCDLHRAQLSAAELKKSVEKASVHPSSSLSIVTANMSNT